MRKKIMCCLMVLMLCVGTLQPKEAQAVAIADDAVVIICCLLAAAGITFATNDGVTDAVSDFLDQSNGQYDSLLSQLASNRVIRRGAEVILLPQELAAQVRGLLRALYDYFTVGDDRTGSVTVVGSGAGAYTLVPISSLEGFKPKTLFNFRTFSQGGFWVAYEDNGTPFQYFDLSESYIDDLGETHILFRRCSDGGLVCDCSYHVSSPDAWYFKLFLVTGGYVSNQDRIKVQYNGVAPGSPVYFTHYDSVPIHCISVDNTVIYSDNSEYYTFPENFELFRPTAANVTLPYGLTFPEELTYEDVLDRFEERVEAAAGDLAIVLPETGVVDNTLTYQEAQEQVLVNVNELGEVTDTTTETNTWLQKLLVAVKAIPATVVGTGSLDFDAFKGLSLTSVFPFCIPFDLKNALLSFNAVPADPVWSIDFAGTFMEPAGSLTIDMREFESLFKIVRFFIYGGFVVSLILLTRKIIKG